MGLFSWLGDTAKTICGGFGIEFTPSGILSSVGKLAGVVAEAVPFVGPVVSNAIPALTSIFSNPERASVGGMEIEFTKFTRSQEETVKLIKGVQEAISQSKHDTLQAIENLGLQIDRATLERHYEVLDGATGFFENNAGVLAKLVPGVGHETLNEFVRIGGGDTNLMRTRNDLVAETSILQKKLERKLDQSDTKAASQLTRDYLDLYIMSVTWLLIFDKALLHLRGYLARGYLMSSKIGDYVACMAAWNTEFAQTCDHIRIAIKFLLGENAGVSASVDSAQHGFLLKLRERRAQTIRLSEDNTRIEDDWSPSGVGWVGPGKGANLLPMTRKGPDGTTDAINEDMFKAYCFPLYHTANLDYFDLYKAFINTCIVDVVENWQGCLVKWNSRVPLSPPATITKGVGDSAIVEPVSHVTSTLAPAVHDEDRGYQVGTTIEYAVSYVTVHGEGFLSTLSDALNVEDEANRCVHLKFQPVIKEFDAYKDYKPLRGGKSTGNIGKGLETIRRVYVRYTLEEVQKYAWLADLLPHETELLDRGIGQHGKLNLTSQASTPAISAPKLPVTGEKPVMDEDSE